MRYLALDIGNRRTGVAFLDTAVGIALPLNTIHHTSDEELLGAVMTFARERNVERILVGLPLLPSGDEGEQAKESKRLGGLIEKAGIPIEYVDERYTTPRASLHKNALPTQKIDGDAAAACALASQIIDH